MKQKSIYAKALVVPQISGTRSFPVPFQKIGNAFLLRSFFRVGTRVPSCVPFAFLSENFNATKYWISIGYLKNSSLRLSNKPTGLAINSGPSKYLSFDLWNSVLDQINQNMYFCTYYKDSKLMFKMSISVFKKI